MIEKNVDLICHSMGGLVASKYYVDNKSSHKINKIITCGTPYEGAPKLINAVQNWDILDETLVDKLWSDNLLGFLGGMNKDVKSSFVSIAQLAPTENYIKKIPMQRDSWKPFNWDDYKLTYDQYVDICKEIFKNTDFNKATAFHKSILSNGYNALLEYPNAYFSIGVNQPTITAIKFKWSTVGIHETLNESDLSYSVAGDGTVPFYSASMIEGILKKHSDRYRLFSTDHSGTVGKANQESVDWIIKILADEPITYGGAELNNNGHTVVRIACPVDVRITQDNEELNSNAEIIYQPRHLSEDWILSVLTMR